MSESSGFDDYGEAMLILHDLNELDVNAADFRFRVSQLMERANELLGRHKSTVGPGK
jgi:hypothetical protein